MTQEQALEEVKKLFPEDADYIGIDRNRYIGAKGHGHNNEFTVWKHCPPRGCEILIQSNVSWEHALVLLAGDEARFVKDDSPVEEAATLVEDEESRDTAVNNSQFGVGA